MGERLSHKLEVEERRSLASHCTLTTGSSMLFFDDCNCDESVWQIHCMHLLGIDSMNPHSSDADLRWIRHILNDIALGKTTMENPSTGYLPTLRNFSAGHSRAKLRGRGKA